MGNKVRVFIDQYNHVCFAYNVADLRRQIRGGGSRVSRIYRDTKDGPVVVGYHIGGHWLQEYTPVERPV